MASEALLALFRPLNILGITLNHSEIIGDHPKSPEIIPDYPKSSRIILNHPGSFSAFLHLSVCCEDYIGLFVAADFGHQQIF